MAIVKNIAELMMGRVEVESEKDQGSTFKVTVNLKLDKRSCSLGEKLNRRPVLVADHDAAVCLMRNSAGN